MTKKYIVGDVTYEKVFKANGIENLSDMQAVLDAVEKALTSNVKPDTRDSGYYEQPEEPRNLYEGQDLGPNYPDLGDHYW